MAEQGMARHGLMLVLGCCLVAFVLAADEGHRSKGVDCSTETDTEQIIVRWHKRPEDCQHFFIHHGYDLEWVVDLDEEYSVYRGPDKHEASGCMTSILSYINGDDYGDYGDDYHKREVLRHYVANVFGEGTASAHAPQPAAVASECDSRLPSACPQDGLYGLNLIKAPEVWNALPGVVNQSPTERVMVLDTGVRATHRDLAPNLLPDASVSYNNVNLFPEPNSFEGDHGSHVAGTVFGAWNNGDDSAVGVVGKALGISCNCGLNFPDTCVIQCLKHAMAYGVRVINMSFGTGLRRNPYPQDHPFPVYMGRFCESGGLAIVAAGNDNRDLRDGVDYDYPPMFALDLAGDYPKCVLNVANVDAQHRIATSSNYGTLVKVAAPGTQIKSAAASSDTATMKMDGTSMAAPHVSGMATLLLNAFPDSSAEHVYDCIVDTATREVKPNPAEPKEKPLGGGIVDLKAAYECMNVQTKCPTHGLPACILKRSGVPVETCDTKLHFCKPLNDESVCQYTYAHDGALCKQKERDGHGLYNSVSEAELASANIKSEPTSATIMGESQKKHKLLTCGSCQAGKCMTESRKWCKKHSTLQAATKQEL